MLYSKSMENVKEGYEQLQKLFESEELSLWNAEFPAIFYGLGMYEMKLNVPNPKYMREDNEKWDDLEHAPYKEVLKEFFPEFNYKSIRNLMKNLRSPKCIAKCNYEHCKYVLVLNMSKHNYFLLYAIFFFLQRHLCQKQQEQPPELEERNQQG